MKRIRNYITLLLVASLGLCLTNCSPPPKPKPTVTYALKPTVIIKNNFSRAIGVRVEGPETRFVYIPAASSRTITLKSGIYKYAAVSKNAKSLTGYKNFSVNKKYTWKFSRK